MAKRKTPKMDASAIILGAKSIITGMFRENAEQREMDDSYFMPMLKKCILTTVENLRDAGLSEFDINAVHDALYQHCLDEYIGAWLANAHADGTDLEDEEEMENATEHFVSFYEEDKRW